MAPSAGQRLNWNASIDDWPGHSERYTARAVFAKLYRRAAHGLEPITPHRFVHASHPYCPL
jgi:hypothetical protein